MKDRILRLLFPPKCEGCLEPLDWYTCESDTVLCKSCLARFESERAMICDQCNKRMDECGCMPTLLAKTGCKAFYKLVPYYPNRSDLVQNRLLYTIKKQRAPRIHRYLGRKLAPAVQRCREEVGEGELLLTYLPRSRRAERRTGTDQARMLADSISNETGIPVKPLLFRARFGGAVQKKLSRKERISNAQTLFALSEEIELKGVTVILVDDLVTTGASMTAAVRLLKRAGAKGFYCIAVASDA